MTSSKTKQFLIVFFIFSLLTLVFSMPILADEVHPDPSLTQKTFVHRGKNLILEGIDENYFFIDGEKYTSTDQTHLFFHNRRQQLKRLRPGDITTPCRVNIVYRQYSITTEGEPFAPGTKILDKITIIQEIAPETLKKGSTRSKKMRR